MKTGGEKVVVAMSGGVDSSVAAALLVEQGYDVVGLFMRTGIHEPSPTLSVDSAGSELPPSALPNSDGRSPDLSQPSQAVAARSNPTAATAAPRPHRGCCSANDADDARFVAGMFDIPFYVLNFEEEFDELIDYFADEYSRGRTPNPCVVCNDRLKFGRIVDYADAVGATYVATGHYARVARNGGGATLLRGRDAGKDQSYVLFGLARSVLDRLMFPIGELTKSEVRDVAARLGLPNQDKPDSVEICFVPDQDYARVVRERRPEAFVPGDVVDHRGEVVGEHRGIGHYTIGQRRGLGIAAGTPIYVTQLHVETNTVRVGPADELLARSLSANDVNYLVDPKVEPFRAHVKIRYLHRGAPALVEPLSEGCVRVEFDEPQRAITPGQAVVFYDGDLVMGGGWIEKALA